jgi:hypothetical protein
VIDIRAVLADRQETNPTWLLPLLIGWQNAEGYGFLGQLLSFLEHFRILLTFIVVISHNQRAYGG